MKVHAIFLEKEWIYHTFNCLNSGDKVDTIYLDFLKALNQVDHKILFAKLKRFIISQEAYVGISQQTHVTQVGASKACTEPCSFSSFFNMPNYF